MSYAFHIPDIYKRKYDDMKAQIWSTNSAMHTIKISKYVMYFGYEMKKMNYQLFGTGKLSYSSLYMCRNISYM